MTENETLKACVRQLSLFCLEEKLSKTELTSKQINHRRKTIKEIYKLSSELESSYMIEELDYKTIRASQRAIKANQERRELTRTIIKYCSELDKLLALKAASNQANKSICFTVYR